MSRSIGGGAAGVLLALSCGSSGELFPAAQRLPPSADERYTPVECWFQPPAAPDARCGYVTLPDARQRDGAVAIATMVLPGAGRRDDPVVFLDGGPGVSAIAKAASDRFPLAPVLAQRDVILVDQRGTGFSDPALRCLATDGAPRGCLQRLAALGHALRGYNTRDSAADIDAVRQSLGYERWTAYGSSYGTRLALTLARDFGAGLSAMVLDGVVPLQIDFLAEAAAAYGEGFEALDRACARQPRCGASAGDLERALLENAARLSGEPTRVRGTFGSEVLLDDVGLVAAVKQLLQSAPFIPYLPALIRQFSSGDLSFLGDYLAPRAPSGAALPGVAVGAYYSVVCQDEATFTTPERIAAAAARVDALYSLAFDAPAVLGVCSDMPGSVLPGSQNGAENEAVASAVRTLAISGFFDPITPPRYALLALETLADADHVVLPDQGHAAGFSVCGMEVVSSFLSGREARDAACLDDGEAPLFSTDLPSLGEPIASEPAAFQAR
jgi:pimeloyl-ACP methyl ester carboxylesterase